MTVFFKPFNRRQSGIFLALVVPMLAVGMMFLISRTEAAAATGITVNSIVDIVADDGLCTLREAITAANSDTASGVSSGECAAGSGDDTIVLSAQTYTLTLAGAEDELNATGDLDITSNISLNAVSGTATIDGNQLDRVLHIHASAMVTITNAIITGGKTPDGSDGADGTPNNPHGGDGTDGADGGGIYNAGTCRYCVDRQSRLGQSSRLAQSSLYNLFYPSPPPTSRRIIHNEISVNPVNATSAATAPPYCSTINADALNAMCSSAA